MNALYWTADFVTGVDSLKQQSSRAIQQLHDLRKLVFGYVQYFLNNGEFLQVLEQTDSALAKDVSGLTIGDKGRSEGAIFSPKRNVSGVPAKTSTDSDEQTVSARGARETLTEVFSNSNAYRLFIGNVHKESHILLSLASDIDRLVLQDITNCLKEQEPKFLAASKKFDTLIDKYESLHKELEKIRDEYDDYLKMKEFSRSELRSKGDQEDNADESFSDGNISVSFSEPALDDEYPRPPPLSESGLEFPINVTNTFRIKDERTLSKILKHMITTIPTTKRKINIPGYKNEIFSSEQFCDWLQKNRPLGLNPSRMNTERLGQVFMDLKLLVNTTVWLRKFRSQGMWFEWSDLAMFIANYSFESQKETESSILAILSPNSKKEMKRDNVRNTSKTFNELIHNVKLTFLKRNYEEHLFLLEEKYQKKYYEMQETRYLLDNEIIANSKEMQSFEKVKIELIHRSLKELLSLVYGATNVTTNNLQSMVKVFESHLNQPDLHAEEYNRTLDFFTTGSYFPSIIPPSNLSSGHIDTSHVNNNFQHIRYRFNIYKDIPLQPQMLSLEGTTNNLLSLLSLPYFLEKVMKLIEQKADQSNHIDELWVAPLDIDSYWKTKGKIIEIISSFNLPEENAILNESEVDGRIQVSICLYLSTLPAADVLNFLKYWLLELNDSVIPCMMFEALTTNYKELLEASKAQSKDYTLGNKEEAIKLLSTMSRSNLSSLIYILEHICGIFNLPTIPDYGVSDFPADVVTEDAQGDDDGVKRQKVAESLNNMEFIGALPFLHLLLRPASVKSYSGYKPPISVFNAILKDLLDVRMRTKLLNNLVVNEKTYLSKKEKERSTLPLKATRITSNPSSRASSDHDILLTSKQETSETFMPRPFRTRGTPVTSPMSTPKIRQVSNLNDASIDEKRKRSTSIESSRPSSSGSVILRPDINVEFAS